MTENEIESINSFLCIQLPNEYSEFVCFGPIELRQRFSNYEVFDSSRRVIDETQRMRLCSPPDWQWPYECVVIGEDGCGNNFCLDLREAPAPVKVWNHETSDFDVLAVSFGSWIRKLAVAD